VSIVFGNAAEVAALAELLPIDVSVAFDSNDNITTTTPVELAALRVAAWSACHQSGAPHCQGRVVIVCATQAAGDTVVAIAQRHAEDDGPGVGDGSPAVVPRVTVRTAAVPVPALAAVVDTNGAGDAFAGGVLASLLLQEDHHSDVSDALLTHLFTRSTVDGSGDDGTGGLRLEGVMEAFTRRHVPAGHAAAAIVIQAAGACTLPPV
jgi:sugar/nucleoside kinase (ribokinase family)